ncbi:MAG: hypothetical protein U0Q22_06590 [Acidimicrobiales bacterium]
MSRRTIAGRRAGALLGVALVLSCAAPFAFSSPAGATAPDRSEPRGRVLIITAPRLTWAEIEATRPPNLMRLFARSAVAQCSPRTAGSTTRPGDAYLTIGAGNRMGTVADVDGTVVERSEPIVEGDPTNVYQRTTGVVAKAPILAIGKPTIDRFNKDLYFGAEAGSMAQALDDDRRSIAVLANADRQFGLPKYRQAGLAAMDRSGQVSAGLVSDELLRVDDRAAFGISIDPAVHDSVFRTLWSQHDVVLVELSDLERAEAARGVATDEQGERQYRRALRESDALVGKMLSHVDLARDTVIVVGPTAPADENQLTVFAMAGKGVTTGWATSSTTRRDGYVTLTDIAPTVLATFGATVPDSMGDTRLTSTTGPSLDARMSSMVENSDRAVVRDKVFGPTTVVFIIVLVVDIALAMLCLARLPKLSGLVRWLALVVLALPPVTFLLGIVAIDNPAVLGLAVGVGSIVVATLASFARRIDAGLPPLLLLALLWLVLAVDIATGGHLQINTIFGYSPIVAGRFAGFGNQAFSMIALASLLLASAWLDRRHPDGPSGSRLGLATLGGVGAWFLVTVVLDGHPSMGSDVGGVLAFVPAATVAVLMFRGIKVNVRLTALIAAGTIAVLGVFTAVDLSRPTDDRTHLGRFASKLFAGEAGEIIQRKIAANLRVLTSVWAWVIPVALVYFAYLTWRPNRTLQRLNAAHAHFRAFGVAALTLGLLAMALNDSGVSLPGIMLALVAAYVSYLVVELERGTLT